MSGTTENLAGATAIRPFRIEVPEEDLVELRRRIAATRWPSKELVDDRSQGVQLATMKELARFWTTDYDWRACEARLNALPQFITEIDGVDIHFIHVRSPHEDALPLIMTHGWPGSVVELLETVGPLTDPTAHGGDAEDAFHLVLPSMPGYGFSGEPRELGWDSGRVAQAWAELMRRLGYTRYVAQGGDGGVRAGTRGARCAQHVHDGRLRLLPGDGHPAADDRLRAAGLTRRPRGLDARPRHGRLLQDRRRVRRRQADREPDQGAHRRQRHALLADGHRGLRRPELLGGRTSTGPLRRCAPSAGVRTGRLHDVPRRGLGCPAGLGRGGLPRPRVLQRGRQGRPLRRLGRAGALLHRGAGRIQLTALTTPFVFGSLQEEVRCQHRPLISSSSRISRTLDRRASLRKAISMRFMRSQTGSRATWSSPTRISAAQGPSVPSCLGPWNVGHLGLLPSRSPTGTCRLSSSS